MIDHVIADTSKVTERAVPEEFVEALINLVRVSCDEPLNFGARNEAESRLRHAAFVEVK